MPDYSVHMRSAELHAEYLKQSRSIEWKVNVAIWAAILWSAQVLFEHKDDQVIKNPSLIFVFCISSVITILHWHWLRKVQKSQDKDKESFLKNIALAKGEPWNPKAPNIAEEPTWESLSICTTVVLFVVLLVINYDELGQIICNAFCGR